MAHYAFLDDNNTVIEVITGIDETESIDGKTTEEWYGNFRGRKCIRTSYNGTIRKNFAGIGFTYDEINDAFIPPKPYPSWILDEDKFTWKAPLPYPIDNGIYSWNEETQSWLTT